MKVWTFNNIIFSLNNSPLLTKILILVITFSNPTVLSIGEKGANFRIFGHMVTHEFQNGMYKTLSTNDLQTMELHSFIDEYVICGELSTSSRKY